MYDVTGSADTTFTATYNSTITDSITVLYDVCFVDYAVTNNKNDNWSDWGSYTVNRTRTDSYTLIEPNDRTTASYQIKYINNLTNPQYIEFDCKQVGGTTNNVIFQLRGSNQSVIRQISLSNFSNLSLDTWYHWKIDLVGGTFSNVTTNQTVTFTTTGILSFFFSIFANAEHNLQYRNFVIY